MSQIFKILITFYSGGLLYRLGRLNLSDVKKNRSWNEKKIKLTINHPCLNCIQVFYLSYLSVKKKQWLTLPGLTERELSIVDICLSNWRTGVKKHRCIYIN
jgi:hypothetical protein